MASGSAEKSMIYSTINLEHHAITTHSTGGSYYSAAEVDVSKSGYTPVACYLYAWSNVNGVVAPYVTSSDKLGFISNVSQTPNLLSVRILYMKST
jgi:hypothetical protein